MKILVAEVGRASRLRVRELLEQWGHDVIDAGDRVDAWDLYQRERPGLILVDSSMPGIEGVDLAGQIRRHAKERGGFPFIIELVSPAEAAGFVRSPDAGADDYIGESFSSEELRARIRTGVRVVELEQTLERKNRSLAAANAEISAAHRRMRRELEAAISIRNSFLPSQILQSNRARFAWYCEPSESPSSDTLKVLRLDENRIGLCLAKVCGDGVPAALLSVHLSRLFSHAGEIGSILRHDTAESGSQIEPPADVAARLNRLFPCEHYAGDVRYFTLLYGILDLEEKAFEYTSAGHPGPIVVPADREKEAMIFAADSPAVGFFKDVIFHQQHVTLNSGDRIYLYTDGALEARDEKRGEFGELRLADAITGRREDSLDESIYGVVAAIRDWNQGPVPGNDISLLGAELA